MLKVWLTAVVPEPGRSPTQNSEEALSLIRDDFNLFFDKPLYRVFYVNCNAENPEHLPMCRVGQDPSFAEAQLWRSSTFGNSGGRFRVVWAAQCTVDVFVSSVSTWFRPTIAPPR